MRLSISIKATNGGFMPELVLEVPKYFQVIPCSTAPCTTWKEAWMSAKLYRENMRQNWASKTAGTPNVGNTQTLTRDSQ